MARFQSHQGVHFYKKKNQEIEDVIGDLEVPDDVLFFGETDALVRLKPSHELSFEKYVAKGVICDLSCRSAFYQWCKLKNEKWNIFTKSP